MLPANAKLGFLVFWGAICAVWTGVWLLVDCLLVPDPLRISSLRLVAIGGVTGVAPVTFLWAGRAVLYLVGHIVSFARNRAEWLRRAASRGCRVAEEGGSSPRGRSSSLGDEYQPSAGPL